MTDQKHGTTIAVLFNKSTGSLFMIADSQVSQGNLRLPEPFQKILKLNKQTLISSTGSVGDSQHLSRIVLKELRAEKNYETNLFIDEDDEDIREFNVSEFVERIAGKLFSLRLNMFSREMGSNFLICGYDNIKNKNLAFSVSSDGSIIKIKQYFADGSGGELLFPQLKHLYNTNNLTDSSFAYNLHYIFKQVSTFDVYTDDDISIYCVNKEGRVIDFREEWKRMVSEDKKKQKTKSNNKLKGKKQKKKK